jgi:hypothetical protein
MKFNSMPPRQAGKATAMGRGRGPRVGLSENGQCLRLCREGDHFLSHERVCFPYFFYKETRHLMISEPFPHRKNSDGTYDSMCPRCYRTVDHQWVEAELRAQELLHVCERDIRVTVESSGG